MNEQQTAHGDTKPCPYCGEMVKQVARKCRFCGEYLDEELEREERIRNAPSMAERIALPVGRPASAIVAGYFGLLSPFPLFPFCIGAIIFGFIAMKTLKANPELSGRGRAIFGIVMGILFTIIYGIGLTVVLIDAADKM